MTMKFSQAVVLGLLASVIGAGLTGCGSRGAAAQAPSGMKVGAPLSRPQVQAIQQKRQAGMQQRQQGE